MTLSDQHIDLMGSPTPSEVDDAFDLIHDMMPETCDCARAVDYCCIHSQLNQSQSSLADIETTMPVLESRLKTMELRYALMVDKASAKNTQGKAVASDVNALSQQQEVVATRVTQMKHSVHAIVQALVRRIEVLEESIVVRQEAAAIKENKMQSRLDSLESMVAMMARQMDNKQKVNTIEVATETLPVPPVETCTASVMTMPQRISIASCTTQPAISHKAVKFNIVEAAKYQGQGKRAIAPVSHKNDVQLTTSKHNSAMDNNNNKKMTSCTALAAAAEGRRSVKGDEDNTDMLMSYTCVKSTFLSSLDAMFHVYIRVLHRDQPLLLPLPYLNGVLDAEDYENSNDNKSNTFTVHQLKKHVGPLLLTMCNVELPVQRQCLVYAGRVLRNSEKVAHAIKSGSTIVVLQKKDFFESQSYGDDC